MKNSCEESLAVVQAAYRGYAASQAAELQAVRNACSVAEELIAYNRARLDAATRKAAAKISALRRRAKVSALEHARREFEAETAGRMLALQAVYSQTMRKAAEDCISAAVQLAEIVLGERIAADRQVLVKNIQEVINRILERRALKITLNPDDRPILTLLASRLEEPVQFIESGAIRCGEALIQGAAGEVLVSWRNHLEQLELALLEELQRNSGTSIAPAPQSVGKRND